MRVIFSKIIPTLLALYRPTALAQVGDCTVNFDTNPEVTDMGVWDPGENSDEKWVNSLKVSSQSVVDCGTLEGRVTLPSGYSLGETIVTLDIAGELSFSNF